MGFVIVRRNSLARNPLLLAGILSVPGLLLPLFGGLDGHGRKPHPDLDFVPAKVRLAHAVCISESFRGQFQPTHVAVQVPGRGLGRALVELAAAEHLAQLADAGLGGEALQRLDLVGDRGAWFLLPVYEATGGTLEIPDV